LASRSEEVLNERTKKIKETQAVAFDKLGGSLNSAPTKRWSPLSPKP
jgi:hypothetical protein